MVKICVPALVGGEVSVADGRQRHDAEVEGLDDRPVLEAPAELLSLSRRNPAFHAKRRFSSKRLTTMVGPR
jgi:hypothetical protein